MSDLDIVGLCGSLRSGSYSGMALRLAGASMPEGMVLDIADYRTFTVFDADVLVRDGLPPDVVALRERIRRADGLLIATPEYNFSIPGGLKNAIDWISRGEDQPFAGKPVAILSSSPGPLGGARVQYELRRVMGCVNAQVLGKPEVFIGQVATKFAADGSCTDEATRRFVVDQMAAFKRWIGAVARMRDA